MHKQSLNTDQEHWSGGHIVLHCIAYQRTEHTDSAAVFHITCIGRVSA
jgi:hypothetical protein